MPGWRVSRTIRQLIRQAYGLRDRECLNLKMYQRPEINQEKAL